VTTFDILCNDLNYFTPTPKHLGCPNYASPTNNNNNQERKKERKKWSVIELNNYHVKMIMQIQTKNQLVLEVRYLNKIKALMLLKTFEVKYTSCVFLDATAFVVFSTLLFLS
jgi:hypothetical protein